MSEQPIGYWTGYPCHDCAGCLIRAPRDPKPDEEYKVPCGQTWTYQPTDLPKPPDDDPRAHLWAAPVFVTPGEHYVDLRPMP